MSKLQFKGDGLMNNNIDNIMRSRFAGMVELPKFQIDHKLKVVTVGGMISAGKTTLLEKLAKEDKENGIKSKIIYELYEDNRKDTSLFPERTTRDEIMDLFLKMYYDNVNLLDSENEYERTVALNVTLGHQITFLATRASKIIDSIRKAQEMELDILYLDRTIFEDLLFTATNLFNNQVWWFGYITVWNKWFNLVNSALKDCDVENLILEVSEETILKRIKKRGRAMEQTPELTEYFKKLNKTYGKDLSDFMKESGWDYTIINNED